MKSLLTKTFILSLSLVASGAFAKKLNRGDSTQLWNFFESIKATRRGVEMSFYSIADISCTSYRVPGPIPFIGPQLPDFEAWACDMIDQNKEVPHQANATAQIKDKTVLSGILADVLLDNGVEATGEEFNRTVKARGASCTGGVLIHGGGAKTTRPVCHLTK